MKKLVFLLLLALPILSFSMKRPRPRAMEVCMFKLKYFFEITPAAPVLYHYIDKFNIVNKTGKKPTLVCTLCGKRTVAPAKHFANNHAGLTLKRAVNPQRAQLITEFYCRELEREPNAPKTLRFKDELFQASSYVPDQGVVLEGPMPPQVELGEYMLSCEYKSRDDQEMSQTLVPPLFQ